MMAGNPTNWWNMLMNGNNIHSQSQEQLSSSSSTTNFYGVSNSLADDNPNQDFPYRSWSQLLVSGISSDQEKFGISPFHHQGNSEDQSLNSVQLPTSNNNFRVPVVDVKPELGQLYGYHHHHHRVENDFHESSSLQEKLELPTNLITKQALLPRNSWSQHHQDMPSPTATSCITTGLNHTNIFNFSSKEELKHPHPDHSSHQGNSTSSGGISKKARVQHSSPQPSLKVRKEKLGDRITALHQLVSPFGKTDTASVLSEAIGYIRFLQAQIQALSSPYISNASGSMGHIPQQSDYQQKAKDLRSKGLCLVPISCMQNIGSDTGADYWAPALGGGL